MTAEDFEYIYNADGSCGTWDCGAPGIILAYDDFSPGAATWFCEDCWNRYGDGYDEAAMLIIVEDKREKPA